MEKELLIVYSMRNYKPSWLLFLIFLMVRLNTQMSKTIAIRWENLMNKYNSQVAKKANFHNHKSLKLRLERKRLQLVACSKSLHFSKGRISLKPQKIKNQMKLSIEMNKANSTKNYSMILVKEVLVVVVVNLIAMMVVVILWIGMPQIKFLNKMKKKKSNNLLKKKNILLQSILLPIKLHPQTATLTSII